MKKKITAAAISLCMLIGIVGCSSTTEIEGNTGEVSLKDGDTYAVISVKDYGDMTFKLYPEVAPKGVQVFIDLANDKFYDGKTFHRIVKDFMIQGGMVTDDSNYEQFDIETNNSMRHFYGALCYANALGKNTTQFYIVNSKTPQDVENFSIPTIENQITMYSDTAKSYEKGSDEYKYFSFYADYYTHTKDFISNISEEAAAKYKDVGGSMSLDGNYTVFGQMVDGFDVLDKISDVEVEQSTIITNEKSQPVEDVIIDTVTIKTYGE